MHIVLCGVVVVRFAPTGGRWCFTLSVREIRSARPRCSRRDVPRVSAVAVDDVETLFLPADALFTLVTKTRRWPCGCSRRCRFACGCSRTSWRRRDRAVRPAGLPRILLHRRRQTIGVGTASVGFSGKCSPICLGWPVKRFPPAVSVLEAGLVELREKDIVILDVPALQATAAEGDR